eukprot:scaffold47310_cov66-Phaeocystis_antarctica.AAC.1
MDVEVDAWQVLADVNEESSMASMAQRLSRVVAGILALIALAALAALVALGGAASSAEDIPCSLVASSLFDFRPRAGAESCIMSLHWAMGRSSSTWSGTGG